MKNTLISGLYIYKLVLPEPTTSQNEESKQVLHGLCSKTGLLQAVQILFIGRPYASSASQCHRSELDTQISLLLVVSTSVPILCPSYRTTEETVVAFHF